MSNKLTLAEFKDKIAWEGGIYDAIDYGLKTTDLTSEAILQNPEFVELWDKAVELSTALFHVTEVLETKLYVE